MTSSSDDMIDMNTLTSTIQFHESEKNERPPVFQAFEPCMPFAGTRRIPVAPLSDGDKETEKYLDSRHYFGTTKLEL